MEWYEAEVQDLERARLRHAALPHPAVFYGSSSIRQPQVTIGERRPVAAAVGRTRGDS